MNEAQRILEMIRNDLADLRFVLVEEGTHPDHLETLSDLERKIMLLAGRLDK